MLWDSLRRCHMTPCAMLCRPPAPANINPPPLLFLPPLFSPSALPLVVSTLPSGLKTSIHHHHPRVTGYGCDMTLPRGHRLYPLSRSTGMRRNTLEAFKLTDLPPERCTTCDHMKDADP
ncbi:hypothetical protein BDV38DRAFT_129003 [Aspergillus pseudotamarii]|uniref:Uncharacterized protein n=1 Tax=Aspergillus pseudotamarii TaxID=132259 RepID=A0A5N6T956_ASPPS|nr:uncharacterized protein BDV38DRAFT_129003 [Aspergillus pseudotamarii]KAE8142701.1 hypothetical protein BDV38DRAFT_129003 [Aspergillus pseudotamarii]